MEPAIRLLVALAASVVYARVLIPAGKGAWKRGQRIEAVYFFAAFVWVLWAWRALQQTVGQ